MAKNYVNKNVYEATQERIKYLFDEFENVIVSFSGGKDSAVCLHMCYDYAKEHHLLHKLAIVHLDYEAQYQMTTDYVDETFKQFSDIKRFWLCIPIYAQCACNMESGYWIPWEKSKQDMWVRPMPQYDYVINEDNKCFEIKPDDFEIPAGFFAWFKWKYGTSVDVVGIRTDESLNRYRAITKKNIVKYKNISWINEDKAYIIYDWKVDDVWIYNAKFNKSYNKLYDLFYKAGLNPEQMRVASPFNDCAINTLKLYKVIDPNNWGKMVSRVNGVNFSAIYGGTTAMGWKSITKPKHFTWKEYCYFLLNTLDEKTKQHYLEKLNTSIRVWKENGCVLSKDTIDWLKNNNVDCEIKGAVKPHTDKEVVSFNEYLDDANCKNFKELPSYKRLCICIMKNDYYCKYMGFSQTKNEIIKKKEALKKYANL